MSDAPSFAKDIAPMFTEMDVDHMKRYGMDLSSRDDCEKHATGIYAAVSAGTMPPQGWKEERWTPEMCAKFKTWMDGGFPP